MRYWAWVWLLVALGCSADDFVPSDQRRADRYAYSLEGSAGEVSIIDPGVIRVASSLSHAHLDVILRRYLTPEGNDYGAMAADREARQLLTDYKQILAEARPESMATAQERLAFWLNAYTALVVEGILDLASPEGAPIDVSTGDFELFTQVTHRVAGFTLTLEEIEHLVLRGDPTYPDVIDVPSAVSGPLLQQHALLYADGRLDPRVNFAVSFGSFGFPPMPQQAYRADTLEARLESRTQAFVNDPNAGVSPNGISVLFEWFARDFALAAGSVEAFIARYYDGPPGQIDTRRSLRFSWTVR